MLCEIALPEIREFCLLFPAGVRTDLIACPRRCGSDAERKDGMVLVFFLHRKASLATLIAVLVSLILPVASPLTAAHADPPPWAPAHGWRDGDPERGRHHHDRDRDEARARDATEREIAHRQQTKNTWRNVAIAAGALGVLGMVKHDKTLTVAGAATAVYAAYRYEQDRKSQSKAARDRAAFWSRPHYERGGVRYERRTVYRDGTPCWQFVRARR